LHICPIKTVQSSSSAMIKSLQITTKRLNNWAILNPTKARWAIFGNRLIAGVLATVWGVWAGQSGIDWVLPLLFTVFIVGSTVWAIYYLSRTLRHQYRYGLYFLNFLMGPLFWFAFGMASEAPDTRLSQETTIETQSDVVYSDIKSTSHFDQRFQMFKKLARWGCKPYKGAVKEFREFRKIYKANNDDNDAFLYGLLAVLLSLLVIIVLGYITFALSCSLSCNGNETAAVIVFVLGLFVIGWLLFVIWRWALRRMNGPKNSDLNTTTPPDGSKPAN
jgi:hypothetical protein